MSVNLSIKNVPDEVARGLRNRAAYNQRSLQQELLEILKQAAKGQGPVTIDALLERAERKKTARAWRRWWLRNRSTFEVRRVERVPEGRPR